MKPAHIILSSIIISINIIGSIDTLADDIVFPSLVNNCWTAIDQVKPSDGSTEHCIYNTDIAGNVGIGTSQPQSSLHIKANDDTALFGGIRLSTSATSGQSVIGASSLTIENDTPYNESFNSIVFDSTGITFNTGPGRNASVTPKMVILNNGNVGIGTTTPDNLIQVNGLMDFNKSTHSTCLGNSVGSSAGTANTLVGGSAGNSITASASNNTAIGSSALSQCTTGSGNTAVGGDADISGSTLLHCNTGSGNTGVGNSALTQCTTGSGNTALGIRSLGANTTGNYNTAIGLGNINSATYVLLGIVSGSYNTGIGLGSLGNAGSGSYNTAIGYNAGYLLTGNSNTLIGYQAGQNITTGGSNILIGAGVLAPNASADNQLNIGNIIYGTSIGVPIGTPNGKIGIGTGSGSPSFNLYVNGSAGGTSSWSGSDLRWKDNIKPISNALDKIATLQGVAYNWRQKEFPDKNFDEARQIGLIGQDVQKVFPEAVTKDKDGYLYLNYNGLMGPMVEAIKELKADNDILRKRIDELKARLKNKKHNKEVEKI